MKIGGCRQRQIGRKPPKAAPVGVARGVGDMRFVPKARDGKPTAQMALMPLNVEYPKAVIEPGRPSMDLTVGRLSGESQCSALTESTVTTSEKSSTPQPDAKNVRVVVATRASSRRILEKRNIENCMEVGEGVVMDATVKGGAMVIVHGVFRGPITATCVIIEKGGVLKGEVTCEVAKIDGVFQGTLECARLLQVTHAGDVAGKVVYRRLEMERGARLRGEIEFKSPALAMIS